MRQSDRWVVATGNRGKLREIGEVIGLVRPGLEPVPLDSFPRVEMPEETGETFLENAFLKAWAVHRQTGLPALADDSGLVVDVLEGEPGVRSARYADGGGDRANVALLLERLAGVADPAGRVCRFVCAMVLVGGPYDLVTAGGVCEGRIAFLPKGENGFGYDPVMLPDEGGGLTMAELPSERKNAISHRGRALTELFRRVRALGW